MALISRPLKGPGLHLNGAAHDLVAGRLLAWALCRAAEASRRCRQPVDVQHHLCLPVGCFERLAAQFLLQRQSPGRGRVGCSLNRRLATTVRTGLEAVSRGPMCRQQVQRLHIRSSPSHPCRGRKPTLNVAFDKATGPFRGSSQTHCGTSRLSGGGRIIRNVPHHVRDDPPSAQGVAPFSRTRRAARRSGSRAPGRGRRRQPRSRAMLTEGFIPAPACQILAGSIRTGASRSA